MIDPKFEYVHPEDGGSFRYIRKTCDDLTNDHPWHFHPEFELSWVMTSHGTRYVGDYIRPYEPGEIVLYGPNLPHCSRNDSGSGKVEHISIQFDPRCCGDDFLEIREAAAIKRMLKEAKNAIMFSPAAAGIVGPLMIEMERLTGMSRILKLMEILERLSHIGWSVLTSQAYRSRVDVNKNLVDQLAQVQHYIDQRFRGIVSQAEVAAQLGMSSYTFSKFIRSATGNTFTGLIKLTRINEACKLLSDSSDRITDVALECGYQHTSHFDRHFREIKGVSPSDYRKGAFLLKLGSSESRSESSPSYVPEIAG